MTTIVTRTGKGSPLTHVEVDTNFTNLNTAKLEAGAIALGSAAAPSISFTGDTNTGIYSPGADTLAFAGGGVEAMRITSAGNVGIGSTSPTQPLTIVNPTFGIPATSGTTQTNGAFRIRAGSTTGVLDFGIGAGGTNQWIQSTDSGNLASSYNLLINPNGGNVLVGLSTANASGAKLQTVDGITFPATQVASADANTLDDYEEGTWTGTLGGTTSESGQTYISRTGSYVKIGKQVTIQNYIEFSGGGGVGTVVGNAVLKGLPFPISGGVSAQIMWNRTVISFIEVYVYNFGSSTLGFYGATVAGTGNNNAITAANLYGDSFQMVFSCSYLTT